MLIKLITFRWRKLKAHHKNPTLLVEGSLLNYKKMPAYKPSIPVFRRQTTNVCNSSLYHTMRNRLHIKNNIMKLQSIISFFCTKFLYYSRNKG